MDGVTANTADINVMSTVAASFTVSVADMKMLKDRAVDITLISNARYYPEKLDISELLLEDDGGTCSDTTKTTEAECLYVVKDSTAPLASTHANYLDDTACRAYASSNDLTFGTVNAESFLPAVASHIVMVKFIIQMEDMTVATILTTVSKKQATHGHLLMLL